MNKLIIVTQLAVFFEVVFSLAIVTIQNDPSKPPETLGNSYSAPRRQISSLPTISRQRTIPGYGIGLQLQPGNILLNILSSPIQNFIRYMMGSTYALSDIFRYQQNPAVIAAAPGKKPSIRMINQGINIPSKKAKKAIPSDPAIKKQVNTPMKSVMKTAPKTNTKPEQTNFQGSLFFNPRGQLISVGNPATSQSLLDVKIAPGIPTQTPKSTVTVEGKDGKIYVDGEVKYPKDETFIHLRRVHVRIRGGNFYVNNNLVMNKGRSDHDQILPSIHNLDYKGVTDFKLEIHSNGYLDYTDNNGGSLHTNYYSVIEPVKSFWSWI